jgi:hypothetical protein
LVTSFIQVPHIVGSVFGPVWFLLLVCRLSWFFIHIEHILFDENEWRSQCWFICWLTGMFQRNLGWIRNKRDITSSSTRQLLQNNMGLIIYLERGYVTFFRRRLFLFFHTHWTYMHIFLNNYWWQKSGVWSQASYKYPISWGAGVLLDLHTCSLFSIFFYWSLV